MSSDTATANTNPECAIPAKMRCEETKCRDEYVWTIPNFLIHNDDTLTSPTFPSGTKSYGWFVELYTGRHGRGFGDCNNWVSITFKQSESAFQKYGPVAGFFKAKLVNNKATWSRVVDFDFTHEDSCAKIPEFHLRSFLDPMLMGKSMLIDGDMVLHCEVKYTRFIPVEIPDSDAVDDFEKYFNKEESSDVNVYVGDKKYPVHTFVLAARSPVFKAIFEEGEAKENQQKRINVEDVDEKTFEKLLRYMYTGKVDNLEFEESQSLFVAADKYGIEKLKVRCEIEISRLLSVETAVKTLVFSDTHNLTALKKWTINFINGHLTEVKKCSVQWKDLSSRQNLLHEVLNTETPETGYTDADRIESLRKFMKGADEKSDTESETD